jgi:DNA mismatch repair protein MutS
VAALAGLPKPALQQARARLAELEAQGRDAPSLPMSAPALDLPQQFGLFGAPTALQEALAAIEPDDLSPKQALEALYRLKSLR